MFKNFPANAGDTGSTPGLETKIPRDAGQLSPHTPQLLKPVLPRTHALQQEKFPQGEAQALQLESSPCSPRLEKVRSQQQRRRTATHPPPKICQRWERFGCDVWWTKVAC